MLDKSFYNWHINDVKINAQKIYKKYFIFSKFREFLTFFFNLKVIVKKTFIYLAPFRGTKPVDNFSLINLTNNKPNIYVMVFKCSFV